MKTGWYNGNTEYIVVKSLHNGHRQSLIMGAQNQGRGRWSIMMGVFPCNATYHSMTTSPAWGQPTSTNKNPSISSLSLALEMLTEVEQEIHSHANGKRAYIYVDGLDTRRLRVYTAVLTKRCGYKKSTVKSHLAKGMPLLYKQV